MTDLITILSSGALSTLLALAIIYLSKTWISERLKSSIQSEYAQKLETHKAQLKAESEVTIVKLRSDLEIAANERSIKLSEVFEKQADVIAATYSKLVALMRAADCFTVQKNPESGLREFYQETYWKMSKDFSDFIEPNKIYLPKTTFKAIQNFLVTLQAMMLQFSIAIENSKVPDRKPESFGTLFKEFIDTSNQVPKLLELLEDDFQRILGFPIK